MAKTGKARRTDAQLADDINLFIETFRGVLDNNPDPVPFLDGLEQLRHVAEEYVITEGGHIAYWLSPAVDEYYSLYLITKQWAVGLGKKPVAGQEALLTSLIKQAELPRGSKVMVLNVVWDAPYEPFRPARMKAMRSVTAELPH